MIALIDSRVLAIQIEENNDPWVNLKEQNSLAFGPSPEVPNNEDYTKMRKTVYEKLLKAQASLPFRFKLKVYEGYRSLALQDKLFNDRYKELKIINPDLDHESLFNETSKLVSPVTNLDGTRNIPPHSTGGAIDIYLVNEDGATVDMGIKVENWSTDIDGSISTMFSNKISEDAKINRKLMSDALTQEGFVNYAGEYWHWSYGDRYWAFIENETAALYGPMMMQSYGPHFPCLSRALIDHYLNLLDLTRENPSLDYLTKLMYAHVRVVPWENNDLHFYQHIELDLEKIILQYRPKQKGGLCYQVNATFFALLYSLGFEVTLHPAMVYGYRQTTYKEPRFTHIVPRVTIDGEKYLADVIWGGLAVPLSLSSKHEPGFYLERKQGEWNVLESADGKQTLQYRIYNRTLTDEDIKIFINYENASDEREVAHRLMFYLHA